MMFLYVLLAVFSLLHESHGFLQEFMPKAFKPQQLVTDLLKPVSEALIGRELEVRLEVGADDKTAMNIQQLLLHLNEENVVTNKQQDHFITTTGKSQTARSLQVKQPGSFINHQGLQKVHLDEQTGVWELLWNTPDSPAGALVMGIDVLDEAVRNDAKLPKGHMFMSFPVWTAAGIAEFQERKRDCEQAAAVHLQERDEELQKMQETNNWFAKLWHYRNAAAAVEKYSMYPMRSMAKIPENEDLVPLTNGLYLAKTGTLWKPGTAHALIGNSPIQQGKATLKVPVKEATLKKPSLSAVAP